MHLSLTDCGKKTPNNAHLPYKFITHAVLVHTSPTPFILPIFFHTRAIPLHPKIRTVVHFATLKQKEVASEVVVSSTLGIQGLGIKQLRRQLHRHPLLGNRRQLRHLLLHLQRPFNSKESTFWPRGCNQRPSPSSLRNRLCRSLSRFNDLRFLLCNNLSSSNSCEVFLNRLLPQTSSRLPPRPTESPCHRNSTLRNSNKCNSKFSCNSNREPCTPQALATPSTASPLRSTALPRHCN